MGRGAAVRGRARKAACVLAAASLLASGGLRHAQRCAAPWRAAAAGGGLAGQRLCFTAPLADRYLSLHGADEETVEFYCRRCGAARSVLELGCGDGRVLLALSGLPGDPAGGAERSRVGLEIEPELVERCRRLTSGRGVQVVEGDMANFSLGERFDAIVMPSSTLYCLKSEEQVLECLKSVRRHLSEGGEFIFDCYNVDEILDEDWGWEGAGGPLDSEHGQLVRRLPGEDAFEKSRHLAGEQTFVVRYTHVPAAGAPGRDEAEAPVSYELRHRYLKSFQVQELVAAAGLEVSSVAGGFAGEAFEPDSPRMVVTCAPMGTTLAPGWVACEEYGEFGPTTEEEEPSDDEDDGWDFQDAAAGGPGAP